MKQRLAFLILFFAAIACLSIYVWVYVRGDMARQPMPGEPDDVEMAGHASENENGERIVHDSRTLTASRATPGSNSARTKEEKEVTEKTDGVEGDHWDDPTNQRVLGPKKWMAEVSKEETGAIEEVFRVAEERKDKRIDRISRQNSIDAMKLAVGACLEELQETNPAATGRLIVTWTASATDSGQGVVEDVDIKTNVGLRDEGFERCVLQAGNIRFAANPGEPLFVEYPFMFDE